MKDQEEAIFYAAREQSSPADRGRYLHEACGDDLPLRERIGALLAADDHPVSYLNGPVVATIDQPAAIERGTQIGPYTLREQIGEGGFGVVYVAEQTQPVARKVALKIIKPGMDTKEVIARFEAERQALAMMDHANIAKVLDAGATKTGQPYFAMELVRGVPITEFCDDERLTARERLHLFVDVCRAVQHAHQKGIIHRDLKPSNVMVTMRDDRAVAKVIDFGIAKALSSKLTDKTVYTAYGQMLGTPLYMSPEQAQMNELDVDTRSDVYSLGVLLYELLTGSTPFDSEALKEAGYDEMRRIIREDEPPKPSARVSTLAAEALSTVSEKRSHDPRRLSQSLKGELDWIVLRAMEKDRTRRYESASDLAADIQRYLNDEPVEACPPSAIYRFRKFARRNKAAIATASVIAVALVLGIIGTSWQAIRATSAERINREQSLQKQAAQEKESEERLRINQRINDAFAEVQRLKKEAETADLDDTDAWSAVLLAAVRCEALIENELASAELVTRVNKELAALDQDERDRRMVKRLDDIRLMGATTDTTNNRFDFREAILQYKAAFDDYGIAVENLPAKQAAQRLRSCPAMLRKSLIAGMDDWSQLERQYGKNTAKSKQHCDWLAEVIAKTENDPWRKQTREAIKKEDFAALRSLAETVDVSNQPATSLLTVARALQPKNRQAAMALLKRTRIRYPNDFWINHFLGFMYFGTNPPQPEQAVRYLMVAVSLRPRSAGSWLNVSYAMHENGEFDEAIAASRKAIDLQPDYVHAYVSLARHLVKKGKLDEAITVWQNLVRRRPDDPVVHLRHGRFLRRRGRFDDANAAYRKALELKPDLVESYGELKDVLEKRHEDAAIAACRKAIIKDPNDVNAKNKLAVLLTWAGKYDEANVILGELIKLFPKKAVFQHNFGVALMGGGNYDDAIAALTEAIELKSDLASAYNHLGIALTEIGERDDAIAAFRKSLELQRNRPFFYLNFGNSLFTFGKHEEAIDTFKQAIAVQRTYAESYDELGDALTKMGKYDEAIAAFQNAITISPDYADYHHDLGVALMRKGNRLKDAIAAFRKAIRLRPDFAQYHDALGDALVRTGNDDGAIAAYRNAIELPPDYKSAQTSGHGHAHNRGPTSVARAHYNRGISYGRIGSLDKAIADINEYLRHQPTGMSAYVVRGKFYYEQKKYKLAMADIEKAMKLDPVAALPHRVRGSFYCRMKQYGEALADYKKAREMSLADHRERMENDKDTSGVRHGLAFFLLNCPDLELRDTALALALAKEAVEADPKEGGNWSVLGQAHYRGENYQAAVDSLAKSIDLDYERKARIWFFLAMAHSKLGHKGQAHEDYQQAAAWMRKSQPPYAALPQSQFRAEAAKVLGIEEQ